MMLIKQSLLFGSIFKVRFNGAKEMYLRESGDVLREGKRYIFLRKLQGLFHEFIIFKPRHNNAGTIYILPEITNQRLCGNNHALLSVNYLLLIEISPINCVKIY